MALGSVSDAVMVTDGGGVILWVNDAFTQQSGYGAEEAVGATSPLVELGEQDESYQRRFRETIQAGKRWRAEVAARHKDGSHYRVIQTVTPVVDAAGSPSYLIVVQQNSTGLPGSRGVALTEVLPDGFQAQLLEAAGEAVIATDLDGTVVHWNPAAERLYGWGRDEAVGRNIVDLNVTERTRGQAAEIMAQVRSGETWSGRYEARRSDGTLVPVWANDAPFYDTDGQLAGIIGVSADISELEAARVGLAERVRQQSVVAELGQYALLRDDPRAVITKAERMVNDLLGPSLRMQVRWSPNQGGGGIVGDRVLLQVPIAAVGALSVIRVEDDARLGDEDEEFLRAVAHVISATIRHQEATGELEHLATHDPLTALPNRSLFADRLELARAAASRTGGGFAVLFLDLDEFKTINDSLGHDTGDEILQIAATRLRGVLRPADTLARFGGDEFAILCPDVDTRSAGAAVARRVQQALATPLETSHGQLTVTASIGIVFGDDAAVPTALLRDVDAAMYAAKDRGRNRIEYFDTGLHELANQRLRTTAHLRRALAGDGVVVHYQPTIELATGKLVGVEALVRLRQADGSLLSPDAFIGFAEDAGLIGALGQRVLEIACSDAAAWLAADPDFMLAVNLSARQFTDPHLADIITRTLDDAAFPTANLWLEITESALLTGPHVRSVMHTLGLLGVNFAIDDFGTGYSSLALLRDTSVDALKIDRGFVAGLLDNPRDHALILATLDLARTFGLLAVAEGIETDRQRSKLTQMGCRYAQGYLWSPPVAADHIIAMIASGITPARGEPVTPAPDEPIAATPAGDVDGLVAGVTGQLLHVGSAVEVRDLLFTVVHHLGGTTVAADQADDAALPVDLTLGEAVPLLPTAEPESIARMHLERYLPGLIADARQALDRLARTGRQSREAASDSLTRDRALYAVKTAGSGHTVVAGADPRPAAAVAGRRIAGGTTSTAPSDSDGADPEVERFLELIEHGRSEAAVELALDRTRQGEAVTSVVQLLLAPAQQLVGQRWHQGHYTVAHEHLVSGIVDDLLGLLASHMPRPDAERTIALVCAEGEWHSTPARMAALCLRDAGWRVQFLGGSLPPEHLAASLQSAAPLGVAISCTLPSALAGVPGLIDVCRDDGLPTIAGGFGFGPDDLRARRLGADGHARDIASAAALLTEWLDQPPSTPTGSSQTPMDEERATLTVERPRLVAASYQRLEQYLPALAGHDDRQRRHTRQQLDDILRYVDTTLLVDDPRVFADFATWLRDLLDARGEPDEVLGAALDAVASTLPADLPRAHAVLEHGRSILSARTPLPEREPLRRP